MAIRNRSYARKVGEFSYSLPVGRSSYHYDAVSKAKASLKDKALELHASKTISAGGVTSNDSERPSRARPGIVANDTP